MPSIFNQIRNRCLFGFSFAFLALFFAISLGPEGLSSFYPPQIDSLFYCQSARQIACGAPFVFSPLEEISTGNTTYLYPFLLAPYYLFGGSGNGIFVYGFVLNSIFYLIFLVAWFFVFTKVIADDWTRNLAMVLLVTFGHSLVVALGQSDMGLFMAVTASAFAALLHGRMVLFGILLAISPWCRPEGTILAFLFFLFICYERIIERCPIRRREFGIAFFAIFSAASVFVVNFLLTGQFQYQSVSEKGHFTAHGFGFACLCTFQDLLSMIRGLFLGLEQGNSREGLLVPSLGGLLFVFGLLEYPWRADAERRWKFLWWIGSGVATLVLVASSGWQGTNSDRYEGWILPIVPCFLAISIGKLPCRWSLARDSLALVLIAFQVCSYLFIFLPKVWGQSRMFQWKISQYDEIASQMPADFHFGTSDSLAYAFYHHERHPNAKFVVSNLSGIYSPSFLTRDQRSNLEKLKHKAVSRFDAWIFSSEAQSISGVDVSPLCGEQLVQTFDGMQAVRANWEPLDNATRIPFDTNQWDLLDSVDVGFPNDEKDHQYTIFSRYPVIELDSFEALLTNRVDHYQLYDIGKPVVGWDRMSVCTKPSSPLRIYLRTSSSACFSFVYESGQRGIKEYSVVSPSRFQLFVDGKDCGIVEKSIPDLPGVEQILQFDIPGGVISKDQSMIEIVGDHIAYQYWFAVPKQKEQP